MKKKQTKWWTLSKLPATLVIKGFDQRHEATLLRHQLENLAIYDSDHAKIIPNI